MNSIKYEEIAFKAGLDMKTTVRYCSYMRLRWKGQEKIHCESGYGEEWAKRFLHKQEYAYSDTGGQDLLEKIDKEIK